MDCFVLKNKLCNSIKKGDIVSTMKQPEMRICTINASSVPSVARWKSILVGLEPMPMLEGMGGIAMMAEQPMMRMAFKAVPNEALGGAASPSSSAPPRVRKLFPETWLWSNASTG